MPRPDGARKRLWITTSRSATGVERPRKSSVSIVFRRTSFAPGTSGSGSGFCAATFGVTGGAPSIAGAARTAPDVVRSTGPATGASSLVDRWERREAC